MQKISTDKEKFTKIAKIINSHKKDSEQNTANLIAFCIWSENMPCQENLAEVLTYINLFYTAGEFDLLNETDVLGLSNELYTNKLYAEILCNLQKLADDNAIFSIKCIVLAKLLKDKTCEFNKKYLDVFNSNDVFSLLFKLFLK